METVCDKTFDTQSVKDSIMTTAYQLMTDGFELNPDKVKNTLFVETRLLSPNKLYIKVNHCLDEEYSRPLSWLLNSVIEKYDAKAYFDYNHMNYMDTVIYG